MARYEHLPIYKGNFGLLLEFHRLIPTFPQKYKFTLGNKIIDNLETTILLIIEINSNKCNDVKLFEKLIFNYEKIKIQIRILKHLGVFSNNLYFDLSGKILNLVKQSEGWKKKMSREFK